MNTHTGFCIVCGYVTQVQKRNMTARLCPNGHGELGIISNKVVKLFLRKGMTGNMRVLSLQNTLPDVYSRLLSRKDAEISVDYDLREPPIQVSRRYGQVWDTGV